MTVWTCPTCDDSFDTEKGMKCHHALSHGESIRGVEVDCSFCGETVRRRRNVVESQDEFYCDEDCMGSHHESELIGENHPSWNGGGIVGECSWCGGEVRRKPAEFERYENIFCDKSCYGSWRSENLCGEDHPLYNKAVVSCSWCGNKLQRTRSMVNGNEHHFCDYDHMGEWYSQNNTGEDSPSWSGGKPDYYGPNWHRERRKRIKLDQARCQFCGRNESDIPQAIDVHHLIPIARFDEPEDANYLSNLRCACRSCHLAWEGIPLAPQLG